jgi:hypothetical protein
MGRNDNCNSVCASAGVTTYACVPQNNLLEYSLFESFLQFDKHKDVKKNSNGK